MGDAQTIASCAAMQMELLANRATLSYANRRGYLDHAPYPRDRVRPSYLMYAAPRGRCLRLPSGAGTSRARALAIVVDLMA